MSAETRISYARRDRAGKTSYRWGTSPPPLNHFYSSLSDEQKARFNLIGQAGAAPTAQR
jgi:hypothetical protein